MQHDLKLVRSIKQFIETHKDDQRSDFGLYNAWASESGARIHDFETSSYYLNLIAIYRGGKNG